MLMEAQNMKFLSVLDNNSRIQISAKPILCNNLGLKHMGIQLQNLIISKIAWAKI